MSLINDCLQILEKWCITSVLAILYPIELCMHFKNGCCTVIIYHDSMLKPNQICIRYRSWYVRNKTYMFWAAPMQVGTKFKKPPTSLSNSFIFWIQKKLTCNLTVNWYLFTSYHTMSSVHSVLYQNSFTDSVNCGSSHMPMPSKSLK